MGFLPVSVMPQTLHLVLKSHSDPHPLTAVPPSPAHPCTSSLHAHLSPFSSPPPFLLMETVLLSVSSFFGPDPT